MSERKKAVVVLSGGQDSVTCLYWAMYMDYEVHCVTFDYNQRHGAEIMAASRIARMNNLPHEVISLGPILKGTSPLVSDEHLEQYSSPEALPGGLEKTFVPMRNQLFLTIAANRAYVIGARVLVTGVSSEDYGGYPDCRPKFIRLLEQTINNGTFTGEPGTVPPLEILTPLMNRDKATTVQMALRYPNCYGALAYSHTAYDGQYPPRGRDHATLLREKGFAKANVPDPLWLRAYLEGEVKEGELRAMGPHYRPEMTAHYEELVRKAMARHKKTIKEVR